MSSYNWAVRASPNLVDHPPPVAAIRAFMVKVNGSDRGSDSNVCSFRFADLRHAENLSLIVSLDDGGRGGCGQVTIIDRTASGFEGRDGAFSNVMGIDDVTEVVHDVNHDGTLYLVFDQQFATEGAWSMFATTGDGLDDCTIASIDKVRRVLGSRMRA
jgi:hypothetical protein